MTRKLVCLGATHGALAGDKLPDVLTVLKWGDNATDRGTFRVTERSMQAFAATKAAGVWDTALVDFEHNSNRKHPNYQPPPRKHAGCGKIFCAADRGLGIEQVQWTPHGVEFSRDYPDLSPVLEFDQDSMEVLGLQSIALVPNGGVIGLSFFDPIPKQGATMEQDVMDRFAALEAQVAELLKIVKGEGDAAAMAARVQALNKVVAFEPEKIAEQLGTMQTTIVSLQSDLAQRDRTAILERATREGKVVTLSAEAVAKLSVAELDAHVKQIPVTVPLERRTPTREVVLDADGKPSQNLARIAALCGLKPEDVLKANAA